MLFPSKTLLKNVNVCRLSCMVNSIVSQNRNFTSLNCTKDGCKSLNQGLSNINSNTRCSFLTKWKLKTPLYRTLSNTIFYHNKNEGNSHKESSAVTVCFLIAASNYLKEQNYLFGSCLRVDFSTQYTDILLSCPPFAFVSLSVHH